MAKHSLMREFWHFVWAEKVYWMVPLAVAVVALSALAFFAENSPLAPFLYPLF